MSFDAIVIGAGPAGAGAARLLAAAGWRVVLVEKSQFPRRKVCGEFLSTPTHAVLEACGIGDAFRAAAGPWVRRIGLFADETVVTAPGRRDWGRALGREHLDVLLRNAAVTAGVTLFQPAEVVTVARSGSGHRCTLDDGQVLDAPIMVAATGSWRRQAPFAVTRPPMPSDLLAFKARFSGGALPAGLMPLLAFPGGYGGLVQSDGGQLSLSCCIRRDALATLRHAGDRAGEAVLRHIIATTRGVRDTVTIAALDGPVLSAGPLRPGIRPRYDNGIFFTGNLAGEAHPVIAEGISMALQASSLLADTLIAMGPDNPDSAGSAYEAAWLRRFGPRIAAADLFARTALGLRRPAAALVAKIPSLLDWGAQASGKL